MLEKIGLLIRPTLRGSNWVDDGPNCQGCSAQFTSIYRKHHCRRCGGLFCNSCTLQRLVLHGQGDSPVRVYESCKKLEEAARFEMQHGHPSRAGTGSSRSTYKNEDEIPNKNFGNDTKENFSSRLEDSNNIVSGSQGETSSGACSNALEAVTQ